MHYFSHTLFVLVNVLCTNSVSTPFLIPLNIIPSEDIENNTVLWQGTDSLSDRTCIKLTFTEFSVHSLRANSKPDFKNENKGFQNIFNFETKLEQLNEDVTVEGICDSKPKVLKVSYKNNTTESSVNLQFHFLTYGNLYELVLIELIYIMEPKGVKYFAFRPEKLLTPDTGVPYGSSYFCQDFVAVDSVSDTLTLIRIKNLQYEILSENSSTTDIDGDSEEFSPVGKTCEVTKVNSLDPEVASWKVSEMKTPLPMFLINIFLLVGGSLAVAGIIVLIAKYFPQMTKSFRKCVFHV